jgi:hypothetical protein
MAHRPLPFVLEDRTNSATAGTDMDDIYDRLFLRVCALAPTAFGSAPIPIPSPSAGHLAAHPSYFLSSSPSSDRSFSSSSASSDTGAAHAAVGYAVGIYDMPHRWSPRRTDAHLTRSPSAVLRFAPNGHLGTIEFSSKHGMPSQVAMNKWMAKTGIFAGYVRSFRCWGTTLILPFPSSALSRQFIASNGRRYQWSHRPQGLGHEWVCQDTELGYVVAYYDVAAQAGSRNSFTIMEECGAISVGT